MPYAQPCRVLAAREVQRSWQLLGRSVTTTVASPLRDHPAGGVDHGGEAREEDLVDGHRRHVPADAGADGAPACSAAPAKVRLRRRARASAHAPVILSSRASTPTRRRRFGTCRSGRRLQRAGRGADPRGCAAAPRRRRRGGAAGVIAAPGRLLLGASRLGDCRIEGRNGGGDHLPRQRAGSGHGPGRQAEGAGPGAQGTAAGDGEQRQAEAAPEPAADAPASARRRRDLMHSPEPQLRRRTAAAGVDPGRDGRHLRRQSAILASVVPPTARATSGG